MENSFNVGKNYSSADNLACLKEIWKTKEFRSFPKSCLVYLRKDKSLCDAAIICWLTLYEFAFFNENFEIQMSKNELAKELGKSTTTIGRILDQLQQAGYLVKYHYKINGVSQKTKLAIRFPQHALEDILNEPNRSLKVQTSGWYHSDNMHRKIKVNHHIADHSVTSELDNSSDVLRGTHRENPCQSGLTTSVNNDCLLTPQLEQTNNKDHQEGHPFKTSPVLAKMEEGSSIFASHTNIINNNIIKKNNNTPTSVSTANISKQSVVVFINKNKSAEKSSSLVTPWYEQETKLNQLTQDLQLEMQKLYQLPSQDNYLRLRELGEKESQLHWQRQQIERAKKIWQHEQNELQLNTMLSQNSGCIEQLPGSRTLTHAQMQRIQQQLKLLHLTQAEISQRTNEIVYEVRFGSLVTGQHKQKPLSVDHAINIALKLVREQRWIAPTGIQDKWRQLAC